MDASPGDGLCETVSGACTLRAAIQESNASSGKDTIEIPGDTHDLSLTGRNEDDGAAGDLDITSADGAIVKGAGARTTTVDANGIDRVFDVLTGGSVEISGISIVGGDADPDNGGGVRSINGDLSLDRVAVRNNVGWLGGGVRNDTGALSVTESIIRDNTSTYRGGGIHSANGQLSISKQHRERQLCGRHGRWIA